VQKFTATQLFTSSDAEQCLEYNRRVVEILSPTEWLHSSACLRTNCRY